MQVLTFRELRKDNIYFRTIEEREKINTPKFAGTITVEYENAARTRRRAELKKTKALCSMEQLSLSSLVYFDCYSLQTGEPFIAGLFIMYYLYIHKTIFIHCILRMLFPNVGAAGCCAVWRP